MRFNPTLLANVVLTLINVGLLAAAVLVIQGKNIDFTNNEREAKMLGDTVRLSNYRHSEIAGRHGNQGALTLFDNVSDKQFVEMGFYNFGAGIFPPHRFEFWTGEEVSVAGWNRLPVFQVRNITDTKSAVWINGDSVIGSQWGELHFAFGSFNGGWKEVGKFKDDGTLTVVGDITMQGQSLSQRLAKIEAKLAGQ